MPWPTIDVKFPGGKTRYFVGIITVLLIYFLILYPTNSLEYIKISKLLMIFLPCFLILFFYENFNFKILPSLIFGFFTETCFLLICTNLGDYAIGMSILTVVLILIFFIRYHKQIFTKRPWTRN